MAQDRISWRDYRGAWAWGPVGCYVSYGLNSLKGLIWGVPKFRGTYWGFP